MKTTENISLAGYAFTIEEDAYVELGTYLNDIREAFASDPSADEITADIEARVAELLKEKYISGMVVDIETVKEIKRRIGDPKMLAQDEPEAEEAPRPKNADEKKTANKSLKSRRLYRNIEERVFGGVCSGLGTYFGLDKVLFRLIFLILLFLTFVSTVDYGGGPYFMFPIFAYICLWIAMPAARTAEQKREMKRQPMNLDNYKSKDFNFKTEVNEAAQSPAGRTFVRAGGVFLGILLLMIGLGGLLCSIAVPAIPSFMDGLLGNLDSLDETEKMFMDIITFKTFWYLIFVMCCIMFIWFIYNGVMLLFDLKYPSWKPGVVLFIAWVLSIFAIFAWLIKTAAFDFPSLFMNFV